MKKLIVLLILFLSACSPCKYVQKHAGDCIKETQKDTVIQKDSIIIKDSVTIIKTDSSFIKLLLDCDSTNNVIIKQMEVIQGSNFKTNFVIKDNVLKITTLQDSIIVLNKLIEKYKSQLSNSITVKENPINIELQNKVSNLESKNSKLKKTRRFYRIIFSGLILAGGALIVLKKKKIL